MVTTWVMCYLITHTSADALDNRRYEPHKCYIMKETDDNMLINCHDDFVKKHVDLSVNEVVQLVNGNECMYAK